MANVLVPLADGFEEIEAMAIIDVLSRAGNNVTVAGLFDNEVEGANTGLKVLVHTLLKDVEIDEYDLMVLPGGLPGAEHLAKSELVQEMIRKMNEKGKYVGAICAAPWALKEAGVLEGKKHTNYPGFEEKTGEEGYVADQKVVIDGNVVTSRGPGTAICFGLELVRLLNGEETYKQLKAGLLADYC
ncbi:MULTISPECIES: DJ-1 family glyoxalase III [unclassified Nitratiruptor]|uniref:DJ-1 family glyoxalase III n=1 Tax=unclassified Nitratiruptor TaxID=2624044 RepID=UPI0019166943|nr:MULTISPECIES: DJ-1 family glyoxalase III [unclassified Nitratiruptor]BCD59973.1 protein deglycase [Nitratiruptor sp. YY08-10]BCD63896.1 protein deglycase [Nitratiruptor sp. YY08-14]